MKNKILGAALLIVVSSISASALAGQSYIYLQPQSQQVIVIEGQLCKLTNEKISNNCIHTAFTVSPGQYYSVPLDQKTFDALTIDSIKYTGLKGETIKKYGFGDVRYTDNKIISLRLFTAPTSPASNDLFIASETEDLGSSTP